MASSSHQRFDCSICLNILVEPHALPCGHSFCGRPRDCVEALRQEQDGIICAVCNQRHNVKLSDLKSLFGIRDVARDFQQKLAEVKKNRLPICSTHAEEILLWCVECDFGICDACVEEAHGKHTHKSFKFVMRKKAARLVPKIPEMASILTEIDSDIQRVSGKVRHLKDAEVIRSTLLSDLEILKEFFTKMNTDAESIEQFRDSKSADVEYSLISDWEVKLQLYNNVQVKISNLSKDVQMQTECNSEFLLFGSAKSMETKETQVGVKADLNNQGSQTETKPLKNCSFCNPTDFFGGVKPFVVDLLWNICDIRGIRKAEDEQLFSNITSIGQFGLELECRYHSSTHSLEVYLSCTNNQEKEWCREMAFIISILDCQAKVYKSKAAKKSFSHEANGWGFDEMIKWDIIFNKNVYDGNGDLFIECSVDLFGQKSEAELKVCKYRIAAQLDTV